ncbi:MAG: pyridoxamine 5'-phosphate oxidase family protein [Oscillospiraceae bacterium]|nr:pyridoxamine 5'-phosphate oxidase family protein [Oscillospiraceae bacterium]
MEELDYGALEAEIEKMLRKAKEIVLATGAGDHVTARMMAPLSEGLTVMMATGGGSQKAAQIRQNPNVALAVGNLKMEAEAELFGHPGGHPTFLKDYAKKFPLYAKVYRSAPEDVLIIARPKKIALYKFAGKPCEDVLLPEEKRAYRTSL